MYIPHTWAMNPLVLLLVTNPTAVAVAETRDANTHAVRDFQGTHLKLHLSCCVENTSNMVNMCGRACCAAVYYTAVVGDFSENMIILSHSCSKDVPARCNVLPTASNPHTTSTHHLLSVKNAPPTLCRALDR